MNNNYIGLKFINNFYEEIEVIEYIEKFKMYSVKNLSKKSDNVFTSLLKDSDIENFISKQEKYLSYKEKREKENILKNIEEKAEQLKEEERLKSYNNDYGFTKNKTSLQKGKILKSLNQLISYDNVIYSKKDLIIKLINNTSYTKEYLNTNRYSKKKINLEYIKLVDKIEYRFYYDSNKCFLEVNKTEYNFINYLIDNKIFK